MKRALLLLAAALGLLLVPCASAVAQQTAKVLSACGSASYAAGTVNYETMDTTGAGCGSQGGTIVVVPSSSASAAIAPVVSSALEACHVLKGSAGNLYTIGVTIQAASGVLQLFDATSAPGDGAVTPKWAIPVISNGTFGGAAYQWQIPMRFSTGITACFSSATTPFTKTASSTAMISGNVQ